MFCFYKHSFMANMADMTDIVVIYNRHEADLDWLRFTSQQKMK